MIACSRCAAENPPGSRFCNQCGSRLAAAVPPPAYTPRHLAERVLRDRSVRTGERKRVTVLFADIKDSTRLAGQAGAEAWHDILDRVFSRLTAAVHGYEGTVNQYTGDGVMALFGAPVAHEDHAARACHAALVMQASVCELASVLRSEHDLELHLRIGLNSGEAVVGAIGDDLRLDYTAQGATVHLAARLERLCEPGEVLLSRSTAALVRGRFRLRSLGQRRVEGVDGAIEVYGLQGVASAEDVAGGLPQPVFLGREEELADLQQTLARAAGGHGAAFGVLGPAGIGKTRLLQAFTAAAAARGMAVHRTAASPYARHQPMAVVRDLYRARLGCDAFTPSGDVCACVEADLPPDLRAQPGALAFAFGLAGAGGSEGLGEAQAAAVREPMLDWLAARLCDRVRPCVLVLEDLQYLDPVALHFVRRLHRAVEGSRSLLLLSWRDEAFVPDLPALDRRRVLGPLDGPTIEALAGAWLGEAAGQGLAERIAQRAAGNPFFVEEAVRALAELGYLVGEPGRYRAVRSIEVLPVPDSVHGLIAARVDRLPPAHKAWLQAAAVIGAEIDADLLTQVCEEGPPVIEALVDAGFLVAGEAGRWRFAQPLVREVVYLSLLAVQRQHLHARAAEALQARCAAEPALARSVADHWERAGQAVEAARWILQAARWFAARDPQVSVQQFRHARTLLDAVPITERAATPLRVAALAGLLRMANFLPLDEAELETAYRQAGDLARTAGDAAALSELEVSYSNLLLQRGQVGRAVELVEGALRSVPEAARADLARRFRLPILMAYGSFGRFEDGIAAVTAACGPDWWQGPIDVDNSGSRAYLVLHLACTGELRRAREDLLRATECIEGDGREASWTYGLWVELAWLGGDGSDVMTPARQAVAAAGRSGSLYFKALAQRALGQALLLSGQPAEAADVLRESRWMVEAGTGAYPFQPYHRAVFAEALTALGRYEDAAHESAAAVECAQALGMRLWELRAWVSRLALPVAVLPAEAFEAGLCRARELAGQMDAASLVPRLAELERVRATDAAERNRLRDVAVEGYLGIGAQGHAERLMAGG